MITYLQAVILGIVQGITEWLPISSSGHLVLLENYFNISEPLTLNVLLHLSTLIVLILVFYKDIFLLAKNIFNFKSYYNKLLIYLVISSIPIGLIGYYFSSFISPLFSNVKVVGYGLLITSSFLYLSKFQSKKELTFFKSILIGISQALALIPGISRSGLTVSTGLILGIEKKEVIRFSFLLAIPGIIGASLYTLPNTLTLTTPLILSSLISILVGYISLRLILKLILINKFHYFSYYCLLLALIIIFYN